MSTARLADVIAAIGTRRVIAVIRAASADAAIATAKALARGGVTSVEIAYTTPNAGDAIRVLTEAPELLVAAGTVTTAEQAHEALDAGAAFLVSPHTNQTVLDIADRRGILALPGVFTPTEVMAVAGRAPLLKLFPASVGGISLLKGLLGPFPELRFVPTGGVTVGNAAEWLAAGAFAVGAGSDLCPASAIADADLDEIEARARAYAAAVGIAKKLDV